MCVEFSRITPLKRRQDLDLLPLYRFDDSAVEALFPIFKFMLRNRPERFGLRRG